MSILRGENVVTSETPLTWPSPAKRFVDVAVAGGLLLISAPFLAGIAVAVGVMSRGPILYGSRRLAHGNGEFVAWKFRTMHRDAERRLDELLASDAVAAAEYRRYGKLRIDPRVTPLGKFLRRSSLDELPQLWNIVRGEMSLVGPRPKLPSEREVYGSHLSEVLSVRPGLTGLWQVSGRSSLTMAERVELDLEYVRAAGPRMDLAILIRTARQVLAPTGSAAW